MHIYGPWVTICSVLLLLPAAALSDNVVGQLRCDLIWTLTLAGENSVRLYDYDLHTQHANLIGAAPYGTEGLLVYDEIEKKLIRFDKTGRRLWSVGQEGSGPEDHYPSCEPFLMNNGTIAMVSYSHEPKIIYYDDSGNFRSSLALPGYEQFHRLVMTGRTTYGLSHRSHGQISTGLDYEFLVTKVEDHGFSSRSLIVKTATLKTWTPGETMNEAILWSKPRIESGPQGTLIVQPDVFAPVVDVYDVELKKLVSIVGDWKPEPRPRAEMDAILTKTSGAKIPSPVCRALPHVFAVRDEEIWLQKTVADSHLTFATYSASGRYLGDIRLPDRFRRGCRLSIHGDLLLCFEEEDGDGEDDLRQTFSLYKLAGR